MPLGTEVGLGTGDIVLDGDPLKGHSSPHNFRPMSIVVKRLMDQDAISYGGMPDRPRPHCVR